LTSSQSDSEHFTSVKRADSVQRASLRRVIRLIHGPLQLQCHPFQVHQSQRYLLHLRHPFININSGPNHTNC
jgi:hypothetical protein